MSDELTERGEVETDGQQPGDGAAAARPGRRPTPGPTPGAAAASRARRIGGATRRPVQPAPPASPEHADRTRGESPAAAKRSRRGRDGDKTSAAAATSSAAPDGADGAASSTVSMTKPGAASTAAPRTRPEAPAAPAPAPASSRASAPGWLRWLPAFVLTVAALGMAAFFAVESHGVWWARPSANTVRDQVLAAAKTCVVAANSYSYQNFAAAEQKGEACTTGRQTEIYRNAMANIKPKADKLKATQVAQVNAAGVSQISQDGKQWTVLVFGQLTVHATQTGPKGRIDPFGAVVRMDHVGGKWLLSSIVPVSSQTG